MLLIYNNLINTITNLFRANTSLIVLLGFVILFAFLYEIPNASAHDDLIYSKEIPKIVSPQATVSITLSCNGNDIAVSGGWEGDIKFFSMGANNANVYDSITQPNSWIIELRNIDSVQHTVTGKVLCLKSLNPDSKIV